MTKRNVLLAVCCGILCFAPKESFSLGLGFFTAATFGSGNTEKTESKYEWYYNHDNDVVKNIDSSYKKITAGLILDTNPDTQRFNLRICAGIGFGLINESIDRKEYLPGGYVAVTKTERNYYVMDCYNITINPNFKIINRDSLKLHIGPTGGVSWSKDNSKDYRSFCIGGGFSAGIDYSINENMYLTAESFLGMYYSAKSGIDVFYLNTGLLIGVMHRI